MRFITLVSAAAIVFTAASAFASTPQDTNTRDPSRICESARLTDNERKECRAVFKAAASDDARRDAWRTFNERINGTTALR